MDKYQLKNMGCSARCETQTNLRSYRDNLNLACSMFRYYTFQNENNKGADQSIRMRRLVCAFVVRKPERQVFSRRWQFHGRYSQCFSSYEWPHTLISRFPSNFQKKATYPLHQIKSLCKLRCNLMRLLLRNSTELVISIWRNLLLYSWGIFI